MTLALVDIYNFALIKMGQAPILSGDELIPTDTYTYCTNAFPEAVKQVLTECAWSRVVRRKIITKDTSVPAFGYDFHYNLPPDCIRVTDLWASGYAWTVEGSHLLTNYDDDSGYDCGIRYIAGILAPGDPDDWVTAIDYERDDWVLQSAKKYLCKVAHTGSVFATNLAAGFWAETGFIPFEEIPPHLLELIVCKLAYLLTYKITQNPSLRQMMVQEYQGNLLSAKGIDSKQGTVENEQGSTLWVSSGR